GHIDLLTVLMHELGHVIGLDDLPTADTAHDLMTETLNTGTRRGPTAFAPQSSTASFDAAPVLMVGSTTAAIAAPAADPSILLSDRGPATSPAASDFGSSIATVPADTPLAADRRSAEEADAFFSAVGGLEGLALDLFS